MVMEGSKFRHESVTEFHHSGELDLFDTIGRVAFVASRSSVLVVVSENDALAIKKAVVKRVSVPARILWIIRSIDFPANDRLARSVFGVLDDLERHSSPCGMEPIKDKSMGHTPSKTGQFLCNPVTDSRVVFSRPLRTVSVADRICSNQ